MKLSAVATVLLCLFGSAQAVSNCSKLTGVAKETCNNSAHQLKANQAAADQAARVAQKEERAKKQSEAKAAKQAQKEARAKKLADEKAAAAHQASLSTQNPASKCSKLTGASHTACLNAEMQELQQSSAKADRTTKGLDKVAAGVETVNKGGKIAAESTAGYVGGEVGAVVGGPTGAIVGGAVGGKAGETAYDALGKVGTAMVPDCTKSGNSGVAGSTPQGCTPKK